MHPIETITSLNQLSVKQPQMEDIPIAVGDKEDS